MRVGQQLSLYTETTAGLGEPGPQPHGVVGERVAVFGVGVDQAVTWSSTINGARRGVTRIRATLAPEVRPDGYRCPASRSLSVGPTHAGDAWTLAELVVLDHVDLLHKFRRGRPGVMLDMPCHGSVNATLASSAPGIAWSEAPPHPGKVDHPSGTSHNAGQPAEPCFEICLVCHALARGGSGDGRALRPGGVEVGQHPSLGYTLVAGARRRVPYRESADQRQRMARRSLPEGVLGITPGSSTTTLRGRTSTSATTSVRDLLLDAAHLGRVLPVVCLHGDGERLPRVSGVEAHRDGRARPDPGNACGGAFDVRR